MLPAKCNGKSSSGDKRRFEKPHLGRSSRREAALSSGLLRTGTLKSQSRLTSAVTLQAGSKPDDIAYVKPMTTDASHHAPGPMLAPTGSTPFGRPGMGLWALYGLGSEPDTLLGCVVLNSAGGLSGGARWF